MLPITTQRRYPDPLKVNLGGGNSKIPGYISVDLYDKEADIQADICNLPFENNSVDHIVCYQVIEHVPYQKSQKVFDEMYRVLKPGAKAIIETPDIEYVCMAILQDGMTDNWMFNLVGEYYRPWDKNRYEDWEHNAASIHRNPWTFERLQRFTDKFTIRRLELDEMLYKYPENLGVELTK
jgi:predicted SAM-dependent methyltransferase